MDNRLLSACVEGDVSTVRKILRKEPTLDVNIREPLGLGALGHACRGGHYEVVKLLLGAQAQVNIHDAHLVTPLHLAVKAGHCDLVKLLILHGANVKAANKTGVLPIDFTSYNTDTWRVLHEAAQDIMPNIEEKSEVPIIPDFALHQDTKKKKKKGKKKGKGKKGGKKKGKKKKK